MTVNKWIIYRESRNASYFINTSKGEKYDNTTNLVSITGQTWWMSNPKETIIFFKRYVL